MPIYDFTCKCGEVTEARAGYDADALPCPACGQPAKRATVYRIAIGAKEKKYRVSDVVEAGQELDYAYDRQEQREGQRAKRPSPYKAAMNKVRRAAV